MAYWICQERLNKKFETTTELADLIAKKCGRKTQKIHPATRIFQALRMVVNQELNSLERVMEDALKLLNSGGRLIIVSFHSLEDRLVKNFFRANAKDFINLPDQLKTTLLKPKLKLITKKPVTPSTEELQINPRSRSAKLRVAERI